MSRFPVLGKPKNAWSRRDFMRLVYKGEAHLIFCAEPGRGKSASIAKPNLIEYDSSVAANDFNNELTIATALWRATVLDQEVSIFAPFGGIEDRFLRLDEVPNIQMASFNAIDCIRKSQSPLTTAMALADTQILGNEKEPYWSEGAKLNFAARALFVATDPILDTPQISRDMDTLWACLNDPHREREILPVMLQSANSTIAQQAKIYHKPGKDNREVSGLRNHLTINCTPSFGEPKILNTMLDTNVEFSQMNKRRMTVFFCLPGHAVQSHFRYLRYLNSGMLSEIEGGGRRAHDSQQGPTLFVLDEFAALKNFQLLVDAMARMRGFGCKFMSLIQNFSQLSAIYGEHGWRQILGNAGCVSFFGGTNDPMTAELMSKLCGVSTIVTTSESVSGRPGHGGSTGHQTAGRPLYTPDEIARLPLPDQIIKITGKNPMQEELFHPDLRDFPAYRMFMHCLDHGMPVMQAAGIAKKALGHVFDERRYQPPVQRSYSFPARPYRNAAGLSLKSVQRGFARLMGQEDNF